jgi:D-alanine-D-alanine ligase
VFRLLKGANRCHNEEMKTSVLLFGGGSDERLVSVASAQNLSLRYPFSELWYVHEDGAVSATDVDELKAHDRPFEKAFHPKGRPFAASITAALPQLAGKTIFMGFHGTEGEDGQLQELFEKNGIAFTGSGSGSSRLCFDKIRAKETATEAGIATARHIFIDAKKPDAAAEDLKAFFAQNGRIVVKPVANGSSFGLFIVASIEDLEKAIQGIRSLPYGSFMAEPFIEGRELTVGVLEALDGSVLALPPSEVVLNSGRTFDYEGKYLGRGTTEITPADLTPGDWEKAQALAVKAHQAMGCAGYTRTDMILTANGPVYLETNTLPGLSRASFIPQQLEVAKVTVSDFVETQLQLARKRLNR